MRNLKRALSLALASVMVLGMTVVGTGASYTDVTSKQNQEAIEVLQAVGIMVGDENGNFNPDQKVTRNEMAVVMSNLMDYRAATYAGTSPFTDVPSWAEPYVAACWTNGITSGYTKTTYGGSDTVTTSQAALMLMKALGYFQYSSDFGSDWQFATIKKAGQIDLFDDVDSGVREAMTRNDLAQLVLNALKTPTVEAEKDGQDIVVNGVTISSNVKYNYITSKKDYATAIDDVLDSNNDGTKLNGNTVELGEKLYSGDLKKSSTGDTSTVPAAPGPTSPPRSAITPTPLTASGPPRSPIRPCMMPLAPMPTTTIPGLCTAMATRLTRLIRMSRTTLRAAMSLSAPAARPAASVF